MPAEGRKYLLFHSAKDVWLCIHEERISPGWGGYRTHLDFSLGPPNYITNTRGIPRCPEHSRIFTLEDNRGRAWNGMHRSQRVRNAAKSSRKDLGIDA